MKAVTQWLGMDVKPERDGVYQVLNKFANVFYARWDKGVWHITSSSPHKAAKHYRQSEDCYSGFVTGWRGLAERSKP